MQTVNKKALVEKLLKEEKITFDQALMLMEKETEIVIQKETVYVPQLINVYPFPTTIPPQIPLPNYPTYPTDPFGNPIPYCRPHTTGDPLPQLPYTICDTVTYSPPEISGVK